MFKRHSRLLRRPGFESNKKIFSANKLIAISLVFFLILIGLVFSVFGNFFKIKNIDLNLKKVECADQNSINSSINLLGKQIFFVNNLILQKDLRKKFPCLEKIEITKKFPNQISINLTNRVGQVILKQINIATDSSTLNLNPQTISSQTALLKDYPDSSVSGYLVVDETGFVFSKDINRWQLPQIDIQYKKINLGDYIDDYTKQAVVIVEKLRSFGQVNKSKILEDKFLITEIPQKVIFSLEKDPNYQLASLQLILQKAKMNSTDFSPQEKDLKMIESIDLRFDKPIVIYSPKNK
ncbi:FtsQ-type POTRA domain-containing protein [Candidatus Daviesbacteria bacterium]|nr:FtsQ-type POTRA domain-containing protein [Candidatus Daviesbacteria bacterium]